MFELLGTRFRVQKSKVVKWYKLTAQRETRKQAGRRLDSSPSANFVAMATKIGPTCKSLCAQIARCCHHTRVYCIRDLLRVTVCSMAAHQ